MSLSSVTAPALPAALAANSRPVTVVPVAPTGVIDAGDRERWVHAESWNVVTIGWARSSGSFSSSK